MSEGKKLVNKLFKWLIIPVTITALSLYIYFAEGWENIKYVFMNLNYNYFFIALGVMTMSLLFKQLSFAFMRNHYQKKVPFHCTIHTTLVGDFWEYLTPTTFVMSSIIQINTMNKQGLPPSKGTAVVFARQCCSNIAFILFSIAMVTIKREYFVEHFTPLLWSIFGLGILLCGGMISLYLLAPRQDKGIIKIVSGVINLLHRIHLVSDKRKEHLLEKTRVQVANLKENMINLDYSPLEWAACIFIIVCQYCCLYSVHFFSAQALGVPLEYSLFTLVAVLSVMEMVTSVVPIPGGVGINDLMFHTMVMPIAGETYINFMLLFYRLITYYFPLILGAFMLPIKSDRRQFPVD